MRTSLFCLLCLVLYSCSSKQYIYYKYNGVTITRIDSRGAESCFYYGSYKKNSKLPTSYIVSKYPNGEQLMSGYLVFNKNKSVAFVIVADYFEEHGLDSSIYIKDINDNSVFGAWMDSIQNHYNNVIQISDAINNEKELNTKNHSEVKAIYPK